jgi:hypothetical protein
MINSRFLDGMTIEAAKKMSPNALKTRRAAMHLSASGR